MSKWFLSSPGELIFEHGEDAKEISVVWSPVEPSGAQAALRATVDGPKKSGLCSWRKDDKGW